jgi:hypothetical protein
MATPKVTKVEQENQQKSSFEKLIWQRAAFLWKKGISEIRQKDIADHAKVNKVVIHRIVKQHKIPSGINTLKLLSKFKLLRRPEEEIMDIPIDPEKFKKLPIPLQNYILQLNSFVNTEDIKRLCQRINEGPKDVDEYLAELGQPRTDVKTPKKGAKAK